MLFQHAYLTSFQRFFTSFARWAVYIDLAFVLVESIIKVHKCTGSEMMAVVGNKLKYASKRKGRGDGTYIFNKSKLHIQIPVFDNLIKSLLAELLLTTFVILQTITQH